MPSVFSDNKELSMRLSQVMVAAALVLGLVPAGRAAEIVSPASLPIGQSVVPLAAGSDAVLGSNSTRRYLCLMNIGTDLVTLAFDQPAVAGAGWALEGASADGHQGGSMCWDGTTVASSVVHAVSAAGSTIVVLEGQ
jgi:hypothetical protein